MRISYVFDENLPSSATDTEQVNNTIAALSRQGIEIELILPQRKGTEPLSPERLRAYYQVQGNYSVRQVPAALSSIRPLEKLVHAQRGVRAIGPCDLVYTRNLAILDAALHAGHRVMYEHFRPWPDQYPVLEPWIRHLLRHPHTLGMVLHSKHVRQSYERLDVPIERLLVAHNGYDPERMQPRLSREDARQKLELPGGRPMVVYTGRINEKKGLDAVLELAIRLPEATFVLVGSEQQGVIEERARAISNVIIRPWQPFNTTVEYMYAADVLIIPPSLEPLHQFGTTVLPMKLFLYLASGRAILAPSSPDTAELLVHDHNAILVPADDFESQVRELRSLIEQPARQEQVVAGALADCRALTWDARATKIKTFLEQRLELEPKPLPQGDWSVQDWSQRSAKWVWSRL